MPVTVDRAIRASSAMTPVRFQIQRQSPAGERVSIPAGSTEDRLRH